jgi:two-component system, OmpR family, phosphate regulon sensor histidine kinase PhoR
MRKTSLRLFVLQTIIIALTMGGLLLYLPRIVQQAEMEKLRAQMTSHARLIADSLPDRADALPALSPAVTAWAAETGTDVSLLAVARDVVGQSQVTAGSEWLLYRPETQQALETGIGFAWEEAPGQASTAQAAAATEIVEGEYLLVHLSTPHTSTVYHLRWLLWAAVLVQAVATALLAMHFNRRINSVLQRFSGACKRLAAGDLRARLIPGGHDEFTGLSQTFNAMAEEFESRVTTIARQRDEQAAVLEYMADGVLILDATGRVQLANDAATRLLQMERVAMVGRSFAQVVRDHNVVDLWQESQQQRQEEIATMEISHLGLHVRVVATPLETATPPRCMILIQDLTKVRRLETVRRDFISNVSHELRTPIASIKALVDTLRDGALEDPFAAQHFLDRMDTEVEDVTQIVTELLELSRVESGHVPLHREPTPVNALIRLPVERLRPQAERAQLQLEVHISGGLPLVAADAERVRQVVTNLVHNAIKFTPPNGRVTVWAECKDNRVQIAVSDTGVGIPAEDVPRIFERFFKADRARSGGGTGLGLAIARHVVEAHSGEIWVESTEGQGSTFYFTLPAVGPQF